MLTLPDTDQPLRQAQDRSTNDTASEILRQQITLPAPWLATHDSAQHSIDLTVTYRNSATGWCAAVSKTPTRASNTADAAKPANSIHLDAPVALQPIAIQKPWGQEIWFSGIEQRGESTVRQGGVELPLSHYLALAPERLARRATPILLKILDPKPQDGAGNLYFETHDTKQEVYVVTHVDAAAWPDGKGAIRLGMNQTLRKSYQNDEEFRAAYLAAVKNYERVRRKIDDHAEDHIEHHSADLETDHAKEVRLRTAMESFTATVPLTPGEVVQVGPGTPHSLQHGVRVFEFQTPTYERNIISFNQRVLTQAHWDSSYAIASMSLSGPRSPKLETLSNKNGVCVERIVDFDEFSVQRVAIAANTSWSIDHPDSYAMLAIISGAANLQTAAGALQLLVDATPDNNSERARHEQQQPAKQQSVAAFLPASAANARLTTDRHPATLLLALPKPATAGTIPVTKQPQTDQ